MNLIKSSFIFLGLAFLFIFNGHAQLSNTRIKEKINFNWKFKHGEIKNAEKADFDDSGWEEVNLPHDASIYGQFYKDTLGAQVENGFRPRRTGWYRKELQISPQTKGKRIYIEFEGVFMLPEIYLNGILIGKKINGYLGFEFDLTPIINLSGKNVIAVKFNNTNPWSSRWYTGEGIYRNVYLKQVETLHVDFNGTYVSCNDITSTNAVVKVESMIKNDSHEKKLCQLTTQIFNSGNVKVVEYTSVAPVFPGDRYNFTHDLNLSNPILWSLENPYQYKVVTIVKENNVIMDSYETLFGVRKFEFSATKGFSVNDKKVIVKGVNIHHDLGSLGAAAFDRGIERRLQILKDMGCNAIRLSHNPHASSLLDMCDKMGLLVFDECFDKWTDQYNGDYTSFDKTWRTDLKTFIDRDRNHPSVFIWSVGNEVTNHQIGGKEKYGAGQLKDMVDFIHNYEPSRKVTVALFPTREGGRKPTEIKDPYNSEPTEMTFYADVVSENYMTMFYERDHAKYPQLIFIGSETKPFIAEELKSTDVYDLEDYSYNDWYFVKDYAVGQFIWAGVDYFGESPFWPLKGWNYGLINYCDFPKPSYYYTQSLYSEKPMVYISVLDEIAKALKKEVKNDWQKPWAFPTVASHWNWEKDEDKKLNLHLYTNCESIELFLNGKSLGEKKVIDFKDRVIKWVVDYKPGELKAVAKNKNKIVSSTVIKTAKSAVKLSLEIDRPVITADGYDLSYITIKAVDSLGVLVPNADHLIKVNITGVGNNAGVGNGDLLSSDLLQGNEVKLFEGKALLIIRSTLDEGDITVNVENSALGKISRTLKSVKAKK